MLHRSAFGSTDLSVANRNSNANPSTDGWQPLQFTNCGPWLCRQNSALNQARPWYHDREPPPRFFWGSCVGVKVSPCVSPVSCAISQSPFKLFAPGLEVRYLGHVSTTAGHGDVRGAIYRVVQRAVSLVFRPCFHVGLWKFVGSICELCRRSVLGN